MKAGLSWFIKNLAHSPVTKFTSENVYKKLLNKQDIDSNGDQLKRDPLSVGT